MNVIEDTLTHILRVQSLLYRIALEINQRGLEHDASKLKSPEREMYEIFRPKLDSIDIQSVEYKEVLKQMGEGLKHHYQANRHHPEHFEDGIAGMTLIDVVEMVCDWKAAAERKGQAVNMAWASERFHIPPDSQLYRIIENTVAELDTWN